MNVADILSVFSNSSQVKELSQKLRLQGILRAHLKGLVGSSHSFIASAIANEIKQTHVLILANHEDAAYVFNDIENILGKHKALFFPATGRRPYEFETSTANANVLMRAEVLNTLLKEDSIVITYPEAFSERVVTKTYLSKNTLQIQKAEKVSIDFVVDILLEYGFERSDYVIEPGQFSVRGGIIDVFSFSNDTPYRIELFGDEVESIRTFDVVTQLSIETHTNITIVPNVQSKMLRESRQSFLEYISPKSIIWLKDAAQLNETIDKYYENADSIFSKLETTIEQLPPSDLFIKGSDAVKQLLNFSTIEFGTRYQLTATDIFQFEFSPQPTFSKNFDLLLNNLKDNISNGYSNILFSDNEKQIARLQTIFTDLSSVNNGDAPTLFSSSGISITEGFIDKANKIACYTDHQIFERYYRFNIKNSFNKKSEALTIKELKGLQPGDYITHIDHGIGRYAGLEKMEVNGKLQEAIRLVYRDNDILFVSINSLHRIAKYAGKEATPPKIDKLGSNAWQTLKQKTKRKVKEIAFDLIKLYAERKSKKGFAFSPDTYLQNELEASFIYEDTPDQQKATRDVKKDMEDAAPMDRLVCGDVGFGKTEIAIRAAFKAIVDGKQAVVLVPTTILALQHYKTFSERLKNLPCTVDYINRFKSAKEQKETLEKLEQGKIDIIIGTHRLVGKDVKFKDLGILIIDEEQKFGVGVKDKLKTIKANVDSLTLTATPIPRTLQFSMMGARDLSIINTAPPNRYPVQTELHTFSEELIRDAIMYEVSRRGQVFFIHNRVGNLADIEVMIQKLCPNVKTISAHGQMDGDKLEEAMLNFVNGDYDVLVTTTIVESGLDIANANTIIINDAQNFGLSDLHQLRGRVGRSNKKAFCYLIAPPQVALTSEAQKRLRAIAEFSDLGSGFQIAMRDLDIRGAGNLLGAEQSGFITEIGYEMYQKILDEAMKELREEMSAKEEQSIEEKANHQYVNDCSIDTDMEILIPDKYVNNITERLSLYRELDDSKTEEDLIAFETKLKDRFGPIPKSTYELMNTVRLRWRGIAIGLEKIVLKGNKMVGHFISKPDSPYYHSEMFTRTLKFVQQNPKLCKMKEAGVKLTVTFEGIKTISEAITILSKI